MNEKKILIAYFSCGGTTKKAAETIASVTGGTLYEIRPATPYTGPDLDWTDSKSRSSAEMNDPASRPAILGGGNAAEGFDTVFLGFPIWWYRAPQIILTFLDGCDLSGKTVIPFATSGSSGLGRTEILLRRACPDSAVWKPGTMLTGASRQAVTDWVGKVL